MFTVLTDFFAALRRLTASANGAADDVEAFRSQLRAGLGHAADAHPALEHKADVEEEEPAVKPSRNGKKQPA